MRFFALGLGLSKNRGMMSATWRMVIMNIKNVNAASMVLMMAISTVYVADICIIICLL